MPTLLSPQVCFPIRLQTLGPTNRLCASILPVFTQCWETWWLRVQPLKTWVQIPAWPLPCCVTWDKLFNSLPLSCPVCKVGMRSVPTSSCRYRHTGPVPSKLGFLWAVSSLLMLSFLWLWCLTLQRMPETRGKQRCLPCECSRSCGRGRHRHRQPSVISES